MGSRNLSLQRPTPAQNRLIALIQVLFFLAGLLFMLSGSLRIIVEFGDELLGVNSQQLKEGITNRLSDDTFSSVPFLISSAVVVLIGYGLWWSAAAIGSKEPPAWHAGRNGLFAIVVGSIALIIVGIVLGGPWIGRFIPPSALVGSFTLWLYIRFTQPDYQLALGAERINRSRPKRLIWLFYGVVVIGLSTLVILGLVYAVLTDTLELPLPDVEPGELLYITTFDNYNDEWGFAEGKKEAQILTDENGNNQLVLTMSFDEQVADGFYSQLDQKFRDFDLRVITTQLQSDERHDNRMVILFRKRSDKEYYQFEISGDGYYRLLKIVPDDTQPSGIRTDVISEWIPTTNSLVTNTDGSFPTFIRPGLGNLIDSPQDTMNEIRVIGKDDKFWFYVNGEPLLLCLKGSRGNSMWVESQNACVEGNISTYVYQDDSYKQGYIGLGVGNNSNSNPEFPISIAFDNVVILGPPSRITVPNLERELP